MPEKDALEERLNEMLDTEVEFSRLKKDDLELLVELAESGHLLEPLAKYQAKEYSQQKVDEIIEEWYPGKYAGGVM